MFPSSQSDSSIAKPSKASRRLRVRRSGLALTASRAGKTASPLKAMLLSAGLFAVTMSNAQAAASACDGTAGNLVLNCGFETSGSWSGTGLQQVNGTSGTWDQHTGSFFNVSGNTNGIKTVSQSITTIAGAKYSVSFYALNVSDPTATVAATFGGSTILLATTPKPGQTLSSGIGSSTNNSGNYVQYSGTAVVSGTSSTLLVTTVTGGSSKYILLDDFVVLFLSAPASASNVFSATQNMANSPGFNAARVIDGNSGLQALFHGSDAQLSSQVSQSLPLLTGGSITVARGTMSSVNNIVQARLDNVRGRASGDSFLGDQHVWLKPLASRADQASRDGVAGYKAETYGLVGGMDGALSPAWRVGGALAYASSNISSKSSDAPQNNKMNLYQLIGYGSYALDDRSAVNFQLDIGKNQNKGSRQIAFTSSVASSSYDSQTAHVGVSLDRSYALSGDTTLTPAIRVDYTKIRDQGYSETGADLLNLNVNARTTESLVLGIDGKIAHRLSDQTTLVANLGAGYDTMNGRDAVTAAFAGAPGSSFVTYGINAGPWIGRGGMGVVYQLKSGLEITGRYDIEFRDSFLNQTASANLRWAF